MLDEGGPDYRSVARDLVLLVLALDAIGVAFADTWQAKVVVVCATAIVGAAWFVGYVIGSRRRPRG